RLRPECIENRARGGTYRFFRRKQNCWIQVALQGDATCGELARLTCVGAPVETDGADTARQHLAQPRTAAFREQDGRHAQRRHYRPYVRERERLEVIVREDAAPGVEDH